MIREEAATDLTAECLDYAVSAVSAVAELTGASE
jgi:hypothetical protein